MLFPSTGLPVMPRLRHNGASRRITSEPLKTIHPAHHHQTFPRLVGTINAKYAEWVNCPTCDKVFTSAAVYDAPPEHSKIIGSIVVHRYLYCDHCDALCIWFHRSNADGSKLLPRNPEDPYATITNKHDINKFLGNHPECTGVLQA